MTQSKDIINVDKWQQLTTNILEVIILTQKQNGTIGKIINEIKETIGIEAVGVRLIQGEDYPYYETKGFPGSFVQTEKYLCARGPNNEILRDSCGNPILECMCGNVISGKTDASLPFFTEYGSFWTNSTSELLTNTTEEDRKGRTRNRCNQEGYESVALIPIRSHNSTLGLIQLNDKRKGMLSLGSINFFEKLSPIIAIVFQWKQLEEDLIKDKQRYAELFNNMGNCVAVYEAIDDGEDFIIKEFNQAAENAEQVYSEEIIGKRLTEIFPGVKEFGILEAFTRVWKTGQAEDFPLSYYKDRRIEGWRKNYIYKLQTGEVVALYENLTERKKIENALSASMLSFFKLVEDNVDGMIILDHHGTVLYANTTAKEILHTTDKMLLGKEFGLPISNQDRVEIEIPRKDGSIRCVEMRSTNIVWESKMATLTILRDITQQKQAQDEKEEMQKQIFQAAKLASIGELAAGIGHEINNPLAIISGYLKILTDQMKKNDIFDQTIEKAINVQKNSIQRIHNIVSGLRTYARSSSDIIENININEIITETLSFLQIIYEKEGIEIEKHLYEKEALWVSGNKGKFQQILVNLLSNAKDATENMEKRKISIKTALENQNIIIEVQDNGQGIPQKDIEKIFNSFYTTKDTGKGTGLGLSIVKNIITNINGNITVQSQPQQGTTFKIALPTSSAKKAKDIFQNNSEAEYQEISGKALVVDDEDDILILLTNFLTSIGLEVDQASNGVEALNKIRNTNYDYILTDLAMPKMRGEELIQHVKSRLDFKGKIIVITGSFTHKTIEADGFINKPFDMDEIYNSLKQL